MVDEACPRLINQQLVVKYMCTMAAQNITGIRHSSLGVTLVFWKGEAKWLWRPWIVYCNWENAPSPKAFPRDHYVVTRLIWAEPG
jgi:hypothetical protein